MSAPGLTPKQAELLGILERCEADGTGTPSYEQMVVMLGLKSKSGVNRLIEALEERGYISRIRFKARTIRVTRPYDGSISLLPDHVIAAELRARGWYVQKIAQVAA